jgi:hypothetical protein
LLLTFASLYECLFFRQSRCTGKPLFFRSSRCFLGCIFFACNVVPSGLFQSCGFLASSKSDMVGFRSCRGLFGCLPGEFRLTLYLLDGFTRLRNLFLYVAEF